MAVVCSLVVVACATGLLGYRYVTRPAVLTVATGSVDGDVTRLMSLVATRLAATDAPVQLRIVDKGTAVDTVKSFAAGETELAVVRGDVGNTSAARSVAIMSYAVVLIAVSPGSPIENVEGLKAKTVGVVAADVNRQLASTILKAYDLDQAKLTLRDISPSEASQALQAKQVHALLIVVPISEKYLAMVRDIFPRNTKLKSKLLPIDSAGAISATARAYESYDLPRGSIRGSPAIPDEDMTTLRVPFYLVANKKLGDNVVASLAKAMMEVRRDLLGEYPIFAQIGAPSLEKDAYLPIHPGAALYFNGEQQSFLDKYADKLFYLVMLLGFITSMVAAAWKFMTRNSDTSKDQLLTRVNELAVQVKAATTESELTEAEREIDEILAVELERYSTGDAEPGECAALGLATRRLERLISQRRLALVLSPAAAVQAAGEEHVRAE